MNTNLLPRSFVISLVITIAAFGVAFAHGEPNIAVEPSVAAPGGQIDITGADMEVGELFKITLEGAAGVFDLGEAMAARNGDEAGFQVTFTLPGDLPVGSYLIRAETGEGESTTADLTIQASSAQMDVQFMEASAKPLVLDRSKPLLLTGSAIVLALLSVGFGVWLIRLNG